MAVRILALIAVGVAFGEDCPQVWEAGNKTACGMFEQVEVYRGNGQWGVLFIECMRMCGKLQPNCTLFYTPSLSAFKEEGWKCMVSLPDSQTCVCNTNLTRMARVGKGGFVRTCEELTTASQTTEQETCSSGYQSIEELGSGCYSMKAAAAWNGIDCGGGQWFKPTTKEQRVHLATIGSNGVWLPGHLASDGENIIWIDNNETIPDGSLWVKNSILDSYEGECLQIKTGGFYQMKLCSDRQPYMCEHQ